MVSKGTKTAAEPSESAPCDHAGAEMRTEFGHCRRAAVVDPMGTVAPAEGGVLRPLGVFDPALTGALLLWLWADRPS
jgi:hypothetical protein